MNFFSIIIPTYNRASHLKETLASALSQTKDNYEIIVVDDGSTDNTEEIISSIKDPKLNYFKKENGERGAARNYGVMKAKGNYVTFLDSDDQLKPYFIEEADRLAQIHQPHFFHLGYEVKNTNSGKTTHYNLTDTINDDLIGGNYLSCLGVFIHKETALKNLFNERRDLSGLEDWELWLRLAAQHKLYFSNKICATLIDHNERSVSTSALEKLIARHELFINLVTTNPVLIKRYGARFKEFLSSNYSYIALHIALAGQSKRTAIYYLKKSVKLFPSSIFKRRFFAIIKHLLS
jgi:glycosyltransferase involved in cell wall biosynthesis